MIIQTECADTFHQMDNKPTPWKKSLGQNSRCAYGIRCGVRVVFVRARSTGDL